MCTAISFHTHDHYFGRNLDLHYSYKETITITPRNYPFFFRYEKSVCCHPAIIGMAYVYDDYPLYYEATNEYGLSMAGLNFPKNACYHQKTSTGYNIAPFELIPWVLSNCATVKEAWKLLSNTTIIDEPYCSELPLTPLHWMISDSKESFVAEPMKDGLKLYENPIGVLTNNPPFPLQLSSLNSCKSAADLPGDWTSPSRFKRAVYIKEHSVCESSEEASVSQFFHILSSVEHQRGPVEIEKDSYEITVYSSCCNTEKGIYYYRTYYNSSIYSVHMHHENLNSPNLIYYPPKETPDFFCQNSNFR